MLTHGKYVICLFIKGWKGKERGSFVADINTLLCLSGENSVQCEGHGAHEGGARDPGDGASPLHRGAVVRLPDRRQTLPHTGMP